MSDYVHHRKEYEATLDTLPDYRITCIFVDKKYRRKGVTSVGLQGAVLYNSTRSLYERAGFTYIRAKGKRNCVMRKAVP